MCMEFALEGRKIGGAEALGKGAGGAARPPPVKSGW